MYDFYESDPHKKALPKKIFVLPVSCQLTISEELCTVHVCISFRWEHLFDVVVCI